MKVYTHFTKNRYLKKIENDNSSTYIVGRVWEYLDLQSLVKSEINVEDLKEKITKFSGFFSLVYQYGQNIFASVDRIRSHPLFYGQNEHFFFISDSANWVKDKLGDNKLDVIAMDEFQLTGYVTGRDTLYPNVKQLQAGECITIINNQINLHRYYLFTHSEPKSYNEIELFKKLYEVSSISINRLIEYANGRQIVIPLSGGFDSRLIATLLTESKYKNILCFTYGIKGNKEADYSRIVANYLCLPWYYIEYTKELWEDAFASKEKKEYQYYASNYVSLPHYQDWLAVKELKEKKIISEDAIFVPGHAGDMVAGSHIPKHVFKNLKKVSSQKDVLNEILNRHYSLVPFSEIATKEKYIKNRVIENIKNYNVSTIKEFANICELWNWQERQAKFIANSIRVYEYWGYDWWLPMWDKQFVSFFENLPLIIRNHDWYKCYVESYFSKFINKKQLHLGNSSDDRIKLKHLRNILSKNKKIKKVIRFLLIKLKIIKFKNDPLGFAYQFDEAYYYDLLRKGYSYNGVLAKMFINELINDEKIQNINNI